MDYSAAGSPFRKLGSEEEPNRGLFYMQNPKAFAPGTQVVLSSKRQSATGMALLVDESGLLATCVHVLMEMGVASGDRVTLFGASPDLPIEVEATVLREGWHGPLFDVRSPHFISRRDERPDVLREDLAFLQLDINSARAHVTSAKDQTQGALINVRAQSEPVSDPRACLLDAARVLPLGAPAQEKGRILRGWTVMWEFGAPYLQHADAAFEGVERRLHQTVRVRSDLITFGFSGSPLWDQGRRLVVGMIREGLPAMPGQVAATDARAFRGHPQVRLSYDNAMSHMLDLMRAEIDHMVHPRYSGLVDWDTSIFVEPELALARPVDPLTTEKPQGVPRHFKPCRIFGEGRTHHRSGPRRNRQKYAVCPLGASCHRQRG
jgi:hypothetical protein